METVRVIRSRLAKNNEDEKQRCALSRRYLSTGLFWVGKRKVLSDSEDDAQEQRYGAPVLVNQPRLLTEYSIEKSTPKKPASNKKV